MVVHLPTQAVRKMLGRLFASKKSVAQRTIVQNILRGFDVVATHAFIPPSAGMKKIKRVFTAVKSTVKNGTRFPRSSRSSLGSETPNRETRVLEPRVSDVTKFDPEQCLVCGESFLTVKRKNRRKVQLRNVRGGTHTGRKALVSLLNMPTIAIDSLATAAEGTPRVLDGHPFPHFC
jgi:hypothetical protein